jgi:hypothetical protein
MSLRLSGSLLLLVWASPATAQRVVSHDTLSGDSPVAVTCGFCAAERFGVLFRDLPAPARALAPSDFPLVLNEIRIALASARVTGSPGAYTCAGSTRGGTVTMDVDVYAGETPPTGSIRALPEADAWPTETLVWAGSAPLAVSVAEADGSMRYEVNFNRFMVADETGGPVRVDAPNTYLRAVVTLAAGTDESQSCLDIGQMPPAAFPVRDNDGRIADERSFIYAVGIGWLWNEEVPGMPIGGDWGLRLQITSDATTDPDAGPGPPDGGLRDAGRPDGGLVFVDAGGPGTAAGGGCGCHAVGARRTSGLGMGWLLAAIVGLGWRRRRPFR